MSLLYLFRGIGPGYYVQGRWGRRDIPLRDKWAHMNRSEYRAFISHWNPRPYQKASQHKLVEKATVSLQNFPTPRFVGYVQSLRGRGADGNPVQSADQLQRLLGCHLGKRLCFKRVEGFGGYGFQSYFIEQDTSGVRMRSPFDGTTMNTVQWWEKYGTDSEGFLIEEYMEQHASLAAINSTSVNTVRLWVVLTNQLCEVVAGYLRIGRNASQVDNTSSGGLVGVLDVSTGRIPVMIDPLNAMVELDRHPDSKTLVKGFQLPHWEAAKNLACEAIRAFPHMGVVGLDMAFGRNGPILIELNVCPDYIGCAWMDLPLRHLDQRMRAHMQ